MLILKCKKTNFAVTLQVIPARNNIKKWILISKKFVSNQILIVEEHNLKIIK
jgi:hypothetical protein